jgi:hypothetical protein
LDGGIERKNIFCCQIVLFDAKNISRTKHAALSFKNGETPGNVFFSENTICFFGSGP